MRSTSFRRGVRGMAVEVVCVCSLDCERHTELVGLCQAQVCWCRAVPGCCARLDKLPLITVRPIGRCPVVLLGPRLCLGAGSMGQRCLSYACAPALLPVLGRVVLLPSAASLGELPERMPAARGRLLARCFWTCPCSSCLVSLSMGSGVWRAWAHASTA